MGLGVSTHALAVTPLKVTLSSSSGPPTSTVTVSGAGFSPSTAVDLYFDTTDVALTGANSAAKLPPITITVPSSALPGKHWISAVTRGTEAFAQAPFTVQTNWAQRGFGPRGKRYNPYENLLSASTVLGLDLDWKAPTGNFANSSPAVANDVAYVGSFDDNLYAFNATTGAQLWKASTGSSIVSSSPAVANGEIYVGSGDDNLYAFDLNQANDNGLNSPHARPNPTTLVPNYRLKPRR